MPIHDWTRVEAGIFHAFHHEWISTLAHALNEGLLPEEYYALQEQFTAPLGPDVLTLKGPGENGEPAVGDPPTATGGQRGAVVQVPRLRPTAETEMAYYRRKQKALVVRHVSGDDVVAVVEIVSPGNKAARSPLRAFVEKSARLIEAGVHLLILDLQPPGRRDRHGIHGKIWEEIDGSEYVPPADKPLTLVAYEAAALVRAYVVHRAVGDELVDMPLFLAEGQAVDVPLDATYQAAFQGIAARWRRILDAAPSQ